MRAHMDALLTLVGGMVLAVVMGAWNQHRGLDLVRDAGAGALVTTLLMSLAVIVLGVYL